ncbi:MAG: methyl-accepting chemotaxis protein [Oscillatoriaceae cyanobacterium Prado104]|jgi:methyl-accepting chemotaxis protein|nr:methyl-accepting chemotaxis protein [Oscillatoriaceae cyanobacterium Prado104]
MRSRIKRLPLRIKAIIFAIALSTIPVILTGIISFYLANNNLTSYVIKYQEARAISIANEVSNFMLERYQDIQQLANLSILNDPRVSNTTSNSQKEALLDKYIADDEGYDSIAVTDLSGKIILKSQSEKITASDNSKYFQEVIKTNRPVIFPPIQSLTDGYYELFLAAPIVNLSNSKTIGTVITSTPVIYLEEAFQKSKEKLTNSSQELANEEYHLVDSNGNLFASSEPSLLAKSAQSQFTNFAKMQADKKISTIVDIHQFEGSEELVTYAPIEALENLPELGWSTLITNATQNVFAPEKELLFALLLGVLVTAIAVSAIAIFLARQATKSVNKIVRSIAASSAQIAVTVEQQERITIQQVSAVDRTASTMEELGASSRACASQAEAAAAGAGEALALAERGSQAVDNTLKEMATLKQNVAAIQKQIVHLSQQTNGIGNISSLVSDLANQTNMLALNAAVEAVRAGDSGKGFAVIASEIRKLADLSKESASRIDALVKDIQGAIAATAMVTDEGTQTVEHGVKISLETADAFAGVADAINRIVLNSQQISMTAKNQAIAVQDIVESVNSLNLAVQETASGISQVKLGTEQLNEAAKNLRAAV